MGVRGLLGACLRHQDTCCETEDLIEVARERHGIEILVDFNAFEYYILSEFWAYIRVQGKNNYLEFQGGEYMSFRVYVQRFVDMLKGEKIELVFYEDGCRGSSRVGHDLKVDTWIDRSKQKMLKAANVLEMCRGHSDMVKDTDEIRPVNHGIELIEALQSSQCEIHHVAVGEADMVIAKALNEREAYAVLTNDSDFCVMKHGRMIPFQLFDIDKERPVSLKVKVITTDKVMSMLQLEVRDVVESKEAVLTELNHDQLVEMSIAAGNDYTRPYMQSDLKKERIHLRRFADQTQHYTGHNENIKREMKKNPKFRNAVLQSRNFYTLQMDCENPLREGDQLLDEGIRSGRYPCVLMGMRNSFYWYHTIVEDNRPGRLCAETVLRPLRTHIYRIVLPEHETKVLEQGITPQGEMFNTEVTVGYREYIPLLHNIKPNEIDNNLRAFHNIMSHFEKGESATFWFDQHGLETGFIVYLLRYFLHLTWDRYIFLTKNELLALVALVFRPLDVVSFRSKSLRPTVRCVTILNWFQNLYRYAYSMLGSLLHLNDKFPLPSKLFSGAVWTALFMVSNDKMNRRAKKKDLHDFLQYAKKYRNRVLNKKRDVICQIVEGFFRYK